MTQVTRRELPKAVERSVNEEVMSRFVRHQVFLQQLGTSEVVKINALLDDLEADVAQKLTKRFDRIAARFGGVDRYPATTRDMQELFVSIRKLNDKSAREARDGLSSTLGELSEDEADFVKSTIENVAPVKVDFNMPSPQYLKSIATNQLIDGTPLKQMFKKLGDDTQRRVESAIRLSAVEGETVGQAIQRIRGTRAGGFLDGVMITSRREAEAIARTALNGTANEARYETLKENDDLIKGYQWVSTLDSRICLQCAGLDGTVKEDMENRLRPPAHINCRCTLVPVLKDEEDLGLPPVKKIKGERATPRTLMNLDGRVPESLTFGKWLKDQPAAIQNEVLGSKRAALFRSGRVKIKSFTNRKGKTRSLEELRELEGRKKARKVKKPTAIEEINAAEAESARKAKVVADKNAPIEKRIEAYEEGDVFVAQARGIKQKYAVLEQTMEKNKAALFSQIEELHKEKIQLGEDLVPLQDKLKKDGLTLKQRMEHPDTLAIEKRIADIEVETPQIAKKMMDLTSEYNLATNYGEKLNEELMDLLAIRGKTKAKGTPLSTVKQNLDVEFDRSRKLPKNEKYISKEGREILDAVPENEGLTNISRVKYYEDPTGVSDAIKSEKVNSANDATQFFNRITRTKTDNNIDLQLGDKPISGADDASFRAYYQDKQRQVVTSAKDKTGMSTMVHEIGHSIEYERTRRGITSSYEFSKYRTRNNKYYSLKDRYGGSYDANEFGNDDEYEKIRAARQNKLGKSEKSRSGYFGKRYHNRLSVNDFDEWMDELQEKEGRTMHNASKWNNADWELKDFRSTEIVSMLSEDLYDLGVDLADADPEAFKFIVGYLRGVF